MPSSFHTDAGGLWAEMPAGADLDFTLDWTDSLEGGDTIATSDWVASPGITADQKSYTDTTATAWLSGGVAGTWYVVTNIIVTASGREDRKHFRVLVRDGALGAGVRSVFGDIGGALMSIRRDRLVVAAKLYMPGVQLSDEYLLEKLVSAEKSLERELRTFLLPREILPHAAPPEERAALETAGEVVEEEPGYPYQPEMFTSDAWGMLELRYRPLLTLHSVRFVYPGQTIFEVPAEWVRPDKKYGRLQFVPWGAYSLGQINSSGVFVTAIIGMGSAVPDMVHVRYRAGLEDAKNRYPDLLTLVKKMTVGAVLDDAFLPASASTSADGLSQSISYDPEKFHKEIEKKIERLRQSIHGVRLAVL